jgi:hypothetical protein
MKKYNDFGLMHKFSVLKHKDKVEVLSSAIDYMQQFSGRTKVECIAMAMGYERTHDGEWVKADEDDEF